MTSQINALTKQNTECVAVTTFIECKSKYEKDITETMATMKAAIVEHVLLSKYLENMSNISLRLIYAECSDFLSSDSKTVELCDMTVPFKRCMNPVKTDIEPVELIQIGSLKTQLSNLHKKSEASAAVVSKPSELVVSLKERIIVLEQQRTSHSFTCCRAVNTVPKIEISKQPELLSFLKDCEARVDTHTQVYANTRYNACTPEDDVEDLYT
jgi:hypothetical protein